MSSVEYLYQWPPEDVRPDLQQNEDVTWDGRALDYRFGPSKFLVVHYAMESRESKESYLTCNEWKELFSSDASE